VVGSNIASYTAELGGKVGISLPCSQNAFDFVPYPFYTRHQSSFFRMQMSSLP